MRAAKSPRPLNEFMAYKGTSPHYLWKFYYSSFVRGTLRFESPFFEVGYFLGGGGWEGDSRVSSVPQTGQN